MTTDPADSELKLTAPRAEALFADQREFGLPRIVPLEQRFERHTLTDIAGAVRAGCEAGGLGARLRPGMRIGVACGSRGISGLAPAVAALIAYIRAQGAEAMIIPAMGSHGGPTAQGQREVLAEYGVSEQSMGAPVISSLDAVQLGTTAGGLAVWYSTDALRLDGVIPVNRVKPHTDFSGDIESGVIKMCAVGLGKHKGACAIHGRGFGELGQSIVEAGRLILEKANILGGLAMVEDAYKQTAIVEYLPAACLEQRESELLRRAKALMPALPLADIDVLLVQRMGKDISGAGFDPNITGRRKIWGLPDLPLPRVSVLAALELTAASHGNAAGIGVADICSQRLLEAIDLPATYASLITATLPQHAHMPMFFNDDKQVLLAAAQCARPADPEQIRLLWIEDTAHLDRLWASESARPELIARPGIRILGEPRELPFDAANLLTWQEPGC